MDVSLQFRDLAKLAAHSDYSQSELFDKDEMLRLATMAVIRGESFANMMADYGHVYQFDTTYGQLEEDKPLIGSPPAINEDLQKKKGMSSRILPDHPDLVDLIGNNRVDISSVREDGIIEWLNDVYRKSRGFELGTFDTTLLAVTMRQQAAKWKDIALGYISDMASMVHAFVWRVLHIAAPNRRVQDGVKQLLLEKLKAKYVRALEHTQFLLHVELEGIPATLNHYFTDNLEKWFFYPSI